ncbi:MAG: hydroxymethylbilane synthase [Xanthomonadales bacterium]|nr:hydroxymethylbilane synthase [Xanthomonadales bacterium]
MTRSLKIATRRSALAMWQAEHVRDLLTQADPGLRVELVPIVTRGDRVIDRPLAQVGGKGLFLKELEEALLDGRADLAVHSMKDVPTELEPGLALSATLARANPFDAWVCPSGDTPETLPAGARVGTSSLRRRCQLLAVRPDLEVRDLRGNVDTRLKRLDDGDYDAIVLACAGLDRLGLSQRITAELQPPDWLPAATQGIITIEQRAGDDAVRERLARLNDPLAQDQARAERAVVARLEGSCQVPLAAHASITADRLALAAMVGSPDGRTVLRAAAEGPCGNAESIGLQAAEALLAQGADRIISALNR